MAAMVVVGALLVMILRLIQVEDCLIDAMQITG
jgi:hypothetical protein